MDDLLNLVENLKIKISNYQSTLSQNEALTRSSLIDPLLRGLGWNTGEPSQVVPEFGIPSHPNKSADYALFANSERPCLIIEAKKLGTPLHDATVQANGYCHQDGFAYFVVTDGRHWSLYDTFSRKPLNERRILEIDISRDDLTSICLRLLNLWRQRFIDGNDRFDEYVAIHPQPSSKVKDDQDEDRTEPDLDPSESWMSLTELRPVTGKKPAELRLLTERIAIRNWADLVVTVAKWLIEHNHLTPADLPIKAGPTAKRYLVSPQDKHANGNQFDQPKKAGNYYVETKYGARDHIKNARTIIEKTKLDVSQFKVRLS